MLHTAIPWEFLPQELGYGSGLGIHRWAVEAAFALLHWFRRLRTRWEIRDDIHQAFLTLGCAIIWWRQLRTNL